MMKIRETLMAALGPAVRLACHAFATFVGCASLVIVAVAMKYLVLGLKVLGFDDLATTFDSIDHVMVYADLALFYLVLLFGVGEFIVNLYRSAVSTIRSGKE